MKMINLLVCAFTTLLLLSCEKETTYTGNPFRSISQDVTVDFNNRYPDVTVTETHQWKDADKRVVTEIVFTDKEGLTNTSLYTNGKWSITEKQFDCNDFIFRLPKKVLQTYLDTDIPGKTYRLGDDDYVIEFSRNGLDNKQYEFSFVAPSSDENETIWVRYHMVIADDGTLLTCSNSLVNRSVWWYDMSSSIELVRTMYKKASILGTINIAGNHELFIRDKGIIKTVTLHDSGYGFEWEKTTYSLDIDTALPAYVIAQQNTYEEKHPTETLYALLHCDTKDGSFYGLTYGSEGDNNTFFVRIR
ncbi:MAG: hypothetical protein IJ652_06000 [Bacteroidales bacterium]|nr:hypothetical protein [Bacteroidales bacterium]